MNALVPRLYTCDWFTNLFFHLLVTAVYYQALSFFRWLLVRDQQIPLQIYLRLQIPLLFSASLKITFLDQDSSSICSLVCFNGYFLCYWSLRINSHLLPRMVKSTSSSLWDSHHYSFLGLWGLINPTIRINASTNAGFKLQRGFQAVLCSTHDKAWVFGNCLAKLKGLINSFSFLHINVSIITGAVIIISMWVLYQSLNLFIYTWGFFGNYVYLNPLLNTRL